MSLSSGFVLSTLAFAIPVGNDDRPALFCFFPKELAHFTILKSFATVEFSVSFADSVHRVQKARVATRAHVSGGNG